MLAAAVLDAEEFERRLDRQRLALDAHLFLVHVEADVGEASDFVRLGRVLGAGGRRHQEQRSAQDSVRSGHECLRT